MVSFPAEVANGNVAEENCVSSHNKQRNKRRKRPCHGATESLHRCAYRSETGNRLQAAGKNLHWNVDACKEQEWV